MVLPANTCANVAVDHSARDRAREPILSGAPIHPSDFVRLEQNLFTWIERTDHANQKSKPVSRVRPEFMRRPSTYPPFSRKPTAQTQLKGSHP